MQYDAVLGDIASDFFCLFGETVPPSTSNNQYESMIFVVGVWVLISLLGIILEYCFGRDSLVTGELDAQQEDGSTGAQRQSYVNSGAHENPVQGLNHITFTNCNNVYVTLNNNNNTN